MNLKKKIVDSLPKIFWKFVDANTYNIEFSVKEFAATLPERAVVLDAGAGETPFRKYFKHCDYYAFDFAQGDSDWDYSNLNVMGDLTSLPFKELTFDAIICTQVLEHVNEPFIVISEFFRVLNIHGRCLITAPQGWGEHQIPYDYFRYTEYGLRYILKKAGLKVSVVKKSCGYFGYLGNRLTVLPKVLFWQRSILLRVFLFPFELIFSLVFFVILPVFLNTIDSIDKKSGYTLNYIITGSK